MSEIEKKKFRLPIWPFLLSLFVLSCAKSVEDGRAVAFRDDCAMTLSDIQMTQAKITDAGWSSVSVDVHPELNAVMSFARDLDPELMTLSSFSYHQKLIDNNEVFLVLTHVPTEEGLVNGCYLYDFDETKMDSSGVVGRWLAEQPTESLDHPKLIQQQKWISPKSQPNMATVRIGIVSEGGSVAEQAGFSGAIWAATAFAN